MALPADFNKIFGSTATGGLTPISDVNYARGWEFVGSNPPTKNDFSYLQNLSDLKSQWLYSNKLQRTNPFGDIKSDGTVETALENLGLGTAATKNIGTGSGQIPDMSSFTASRASTGWQKLPGGLIIQWGQVATNTSSLATVAYPIPFPNNVFQVIGSCLDVNNANIVAINSTDGINLNLVAWVVTSGSVLRTTTPVKWIAIGN